MHGFLAWWDYFGQAINGNIDWIPSPLLWAALASVVVSIVWPKVREAIHRFVDVKLLVHQKKIADELTIHRADVEVMLQDHRNAIRNHVASEIAKLKQG